MQEDLKADSWPRRFSVSGSAWAQTMSHLLPRGVLSESAPSNAYCERMMSLVWEADDVGDALANTLARDGKKARDDLDTAIERGIESVSEPSDELRAFLARIDHVPDWIDLERVQSGLRLMKRIDPVTFWGAAKGIGFYLAAVLPNTARALSMHASLDNAERRLVETAKYFADMLQEKSLSRDSKGFKATAKVRVLHSHVRHYIGRGEWDEGLYGKPICLFDIYLASLTATYLIALLAEKEGYRFQQQEKDDLAVLAAYHAYLMGVPEAYLWRDASGADQAVYAYFRYSRTDADLVSRDQVIDSILNAPLPIFGNAVDQASEQICLAITERLLGQSICAGIGAKLKPKGYAKGLLTLARPIHRVEVYLRRLFRPIDRAYTSLYNIFWEQTVPTQLEKLTGQRDKLYARGTGKSAT